MPPSRLESVERTMQVLDCFTLEAPELRLTDLSNETGMTKTQISRIVSTLVGGGYVVRDPATKRYRLGLRLIYLGTVAREQMDLRRAARPFLEQLGALTHETVRLVSLDEHGPVCVDLVESPQGVKVDAKLGVRMPWNAGTSGKVILSFLPASKQDEILAEAPLSRFTERTITDPAVLRQQLERIRRQGYHVNDVGDLVAETRAIAVPIFEEGGEITGAISLAMPEYRWRQLDVEGTIRTMMEFSVEVSTQLGYQPGTHIFDALPDRQHATSSTPGTDPAPFP